LSCNWKGASTTYTCYTGGQIEDGEYAISNTSAGFNTGWHQSMEDHTEGDTDGRMFFVNADIPVGEFYRRTISLNPTTDYSFSAWITTVYDTDSFICQGNSVPSNVRFRIEDMMGNILEETVTGDIPNGPDPDWQEFFIFFNTGANSDVQLVLINNAPGGCGNDLAIDDITLSYVNSTPEIVTPGDLGTCDTTGSGQGVFDLTSVIAEVLNGQSPNNFNISFHLSQLEAEVNLNAIAFPEAYTNTSNPETVFVRVEKATEPTCFAIVDFDLVVNPAVNFDINIPSVVSVCDGDPFPELDATPQNPNIDLNFVSYSWADAQGNVLSTNPLYMPMAEGNYSVTIALEPCDATTIGFVAVRYEQPMFDLGGDTCAGPDTILDATPDNYAIDDVSFVWLLDGEQISGADQATYNPTTAGTYTAIVSVGDCAGEQMVTVGPELDLMVTEECLPDAGSLKQTLVATTNSNVGSFQWRENGELVGTGPNYIIDWGMQSGGNDPRTFTVTLSEDDCSNSKSITVTQFNCVIPQGISPNGDDLNDCFDLEFIADRFGAFSVDIYNRYGANVFSQDNYINEFCGVDQNGSDLVTGTYYYVIKFAESNEEYGEMVSGWVYVNQPTN